MDFVYQKTAGKRQSPLKLIKKYLMITLGALLYAMGISLFSEPNNLAPGGVSGISVVLSYISSIETGTWSLLINIPILAIGMWKFGWRFLISTCYCTVMCSVFMNLLSPLGGATKDLLLAALGGSVLMAVAIGIIFSAGATSGGSDVIIKLLRLRYPHMKTGTLFFCTDLIIVAISAAVFRNIDSAMYALISVVVTSLVLDVVLYGRDEAKLIYIISDCHEQITNRILKELDIGVTFVEGQGAYSGKPKKVMLVAVKKTIAPLTEAIVREEDTDAFMIVTSATEIFGEGYKSYFSDKL